MNISSNAPKPGLSKGVTGSRFDIRSMDRHPDFKTPKVEARLEIKRYKKMLTKLHSRADKDFFRRAIRNYKQRLVK